MTPEAPFNVKLLDVDSFVKDYLVEPVTNLAIYAPSSGSQFSQDGLFSETTFGARGTPQRMITYGYINLNTYVLQPLIYKNLIKLAALYEEVMTGSAHAIFDPTLQDFVRCLNPDKHPDAGTGYTFFMNHFSEIKFRRNGSRLRSDKIDLIETFRDILFINKMMVMPAGLRDLEESQGVPTTDDINKLYQSLMSYALSIPPKATSTIYDVVRVAIQRKTVEIYDYIENILRHKRGFIQGVWGHRKVALGTRNVITAASYATMTPNDPQTLQPDETRLGIFQSAKALQPLVVYHIRTNFFDPIFGENSNDVALTEPTTLELAYRTISNQELSRYESPAAIEDWISRFQNVDIRDSPVVVHDVDGKPYYLLMVYDEGDRISLFRSLNEFKKVSAKKPIAVIVRGNPKYLNDPQVSSLAVRFYDEVKSILENRGFTVTFDPGTEYTSPDEKASVWIGHSRGIDRLQFAPSNVTTIALQTQDHTKTYANNDEHGIDPAHYQLSDGDRAKLMSLEAKSVSMIDQTKIRPLTWAELMYMATYNAVTTPIVKHVFITRYPVIQDESCYPTRLHLGSTLPARVVKLINTITDDVVHTYPEYPILGRPYLESIQLGTSRLAGLDADFDGDQDLNFL